MKFHEILQQRRSVRKYLEKEVPMDIIHELIKEATFAPSAGNGQPWNFIIVNNKEMLKRMSDESKKNILNRINSNPGDYAEKYRKMLENESFNVFYNAPCLIIILGKSDHKNLLVDCALAASYLMMSATARNLGTCWVNLGTEIYDKDMIDELGLPEDQKIVAPIILGYPEIIPSMPNRKEPKILKVIS
jgi:nitroreductase